MTYTTTLAPSTFGGGYTATWYFSSGTANPNYVISSASFDHNVVATNLYSFTGNISGTTLIITQSNTNQEFGPGSHFIGSGVTPGTQISSDGTGTGGTGTYIVNQSQTIPSESLQAVVGSVAAVSEGGPTITTTTFTSNYIDPTGTFFCFLNNGPGSAAFSGNINLIDGSTISDTTQATCNGHH